MSYLYGGVIGFIIAWIVQHFRGKYGAMGVVTPDGAGECCLNGVKVTGTISVNTNETLVAVYAKSMPLGAIPPVPPPGLTPQEGGLSITGPADHNYQYILNRDADPGQIAVWAEFSYCDDATHLYDCTSGTHPYCTTPAP